MLSAAGRLKNTPLRETIASGSFLMFFYQAAIMLAVILVICLLAYVIRLKSRLLLVALILVTATAGAGGLCLVQYAFSSHFYTQHVDVRTLEALTLTAAQKNNINRIFTGYKPVSDTDTIFKSAVSKNFHVSGNGAASDITVTVYSFENDKSAEQFLRLSQKFYESRNFLPSDGKCSYEVKGATHQYVTSYIKSVYPDYTDFIYLPSKIVYYSDVVVLDNDVIVSVRERANRPVTNKGTVINGILKALGDT